MKDYRNNLRFTFFEWIHFLRAGEHLSKAIHENFINHLNRIKPLL